MPAPKIPSPAKAPDVRVSPADVSYARYQKRPSSISDECYRVAIHSTTPARTRIPKTIEIRGNNVADAKSFSRLVGGTSGTIAPSCDARLTAFLFIMSSVVVATCNFSAGPRVFESQSGASRATLDFA